MVSGQAVLHPRLGPGRPLDAVLDDPALERVTGDAKQLGRFDDAATCSQGGCAEETLGFAEIQILENDRHVP